MSLPTIVGTAYRGDSTANVSSTQSMACPLPPGIAEGDLLVYVVTSFTQPWSVSPSDTVAWTRIAPYAYSGTLTFDIFVTTYTTTLNLAFFSNDTTLRRATPATIAIRGWTGNIADLAVGSEGLRVSEGLDGYHTIAPSVTTTQSDSLVLSTFVERTTATTNEPAGASVNVGTLDLAFFPTSSAIESVLFSHIEQATAGASGDVTATYPNIQTNNGIAVQLAIPGGTSGVPVDIPVLLTGTGNLEEWDKGATYTSSVTVNMPANVAVGDVLLLLGYNSSSYVPVPDLAGCTQITPTPASSTYRDLLAYVYPVPDQATLTSLPATVTMTSSGAGRMFALVARVTGVNLTTPLDVSGAWNNPYSTSDGYVPGVSGARSNSLAILIGYSNSISSYPIVTDATAGDMTKCGIWSADDGGVSSHSQLYVFNRSVNSDGTVPNTTFMPNQTVSNLGGLMFALTAKTAAPRGVQAAYVTAGGTQSGALYIMTSSGPALISSTHHVPTGYATVATMLTTPSFAVAHRGGSLSYPEMSLYAYTQSVIDGYGAVELSLARTSDGVWFGLHDSTLDRTSGVSGVTASSLTWAQVQTYSILGSTATDNPSQPNRPYMQWEELIAAYYPSHVIFVDPKTALSYRSELLAMMDALPGTPQDHLVAKYYGVEGGVGNTGWAHDAATHGYERWGYFYDTDASNFAAYEGRWSILGLNYTASQATWNTMLSYGKPVIGHVCPTQASVTAALSYGAAGVMVSGTSVVTP